MVPSGSWRDPGGEHGEHGAGDRREVGGDGDAPDLTAPDRYCPVEPETIRTSG
jgi:hypothetical protein